MSDDRRDLRTSEAPTILASDADEVLDALAASIEDGEIDYNDVTTPREARKAALELLREVRMGLALDPTTNALRRESRMNEAPKSGSDAVLSKVMAVLNEALSIGDNDFDPVWAAKELARRAADAASIAPAKRNPDLKRCAACGHFAIAGGSHTAECPLRNLSAAETPPLQRPRPTEAPAEHCKDMGHGCYPDRCICLCGFCRRAVGERRSPDELRDIATRFLLGCGKAPYSAPLDDVERLAGLLSGHGHRTDYLLALCGDTASIDGDPCILADGHKGACDWRDAETLLRHTAAELEEVAIKLRSFPRPETPASSPEKKDQGRE